VAAQVLQCLSRAPADIDALVAEIAGILTLPPSSNLAESIGKTVQEFSRIGLIETAAT
jgi:hypothetical protein